MKRKLKIIKSENRETHEEKVNEFLEQETIEVLDTSHDTVVNVYHNEYGITSDISYITYITYIEKGRLLFSDDIETIRDRYKLVTGEAYKIKLLSEDVIHMEEREFGTKALVKNHGYRQYDESLTVTTPTMEELMYFMTKRGKERW